MLKRSAIALLLLAGMTLSTSVHAVEIWYDFEGDSGAVVTDKLTGDGSQNGLLGGNASVQSSDVLFGAQSAAFDIPEGPPPPFSTFEVPGSTSLDAEYIIAAHVDAEPGYTHLFSSFRGTGPVGTDRVLMDIDATGTVIPGIRAVVNNVSVQTASPPAGMSDPGYHHYALIVTNGLVLLFFDGVQVGGGVVGIGYSNSANIHVGEDPHDGGGTIDEQLIGNVDELLVLGERSIPAVEVAALASSPVSSVVTPDGTEYAVYYDFEGDLDDQFPTEAAQNAIPHRAATIDTDPANAAFGSGSGRLDQPDSGFSRIDAGAPGNLGDAFTISVAVDYPQAGYDAGALTRLFSTYDGSGSAAGDLIFDFDPNASFGLGVRLILPDGTNVTAPDTQALNTLHTFTATYEQGDVRVYLDGALIANATTSGDVDLGSRVLYIGEDSAGIINENFIGTLDDAFILERVLTPAEVLAVHQQGAAAVLDQPLSAPALGPGAQGLLGALLLISAVCAWRRSAPCGASGSRGRSGGAGARRPRSP